MWQLSKHTVERSIKRRYCTWILSQGFAVITKKHLFIPRKTASHILPLCPVLQPHFHFPSTCIVILRPSTICPLCQSPDSHIHLLTCSTFPHQPCSIYTSSSPPAPCQIVTVLMLLIVFGYSHCFGYIHAESLNAQSDLSLRSDVFVHIIFKMWPISDSSMNWSQPWTDAHAQKNNKTITKTSHTARCRT